MLNGSDINVVMNQVSIPVNLSQKEAVIVQVQGIDIVISLLAVITILCFFILYFVVKRRGIA